MTDITRKTAPDALVALTLTMGNSSVQPLTLSQWNGLVRYMGQESLSPSDLATASLARLPRGASSKPQITALLAHQSEMESRLADWKRIGIWAIFRRDDGYPAALRKKLGDERPAAFFGAGGRLPLPDTPVLAVVGSRNAPEASLNSASALGEKAASEGWTLVSGGARGVDRSAMMGALKAGGRVVGFLPCNMSQTVAELRYSPYLRSGKLTLLSHVRPDAGFEARSAHQRNKYIYALADIAVAVHSGTTGGTWTGAIENIRRGYSPMWVMENGAEGNVKLIERGASALPEDITDVRLGEIARLRT